MILADYEAPPEPSQWPLFLALVWLPLGWTLIGPTLLTPSVVKGLLVAVLALVQLLVVFPAPVLSYVHIYHRRHSHLPALLSAGAAYFASCFVTNFLGLLLLAKL